MRQHLNKLWHDVYPDGTPCPTVRPGDIRGRVNAALDAASPERRQPMRHKTRFAAILIAAAVALGGTALAFTVRWDVLDVFFSGDTTPAQSLVDRERRSVSDENYTFTVESSVSDGDTYQFQEVLDLSQLAAVVFDGTAYPLDGGAPYAQAVDPRLYPFQLPLMDRLSEDSGLALPLEALCEALGASYTWDGGTQTAVCSYRDTTLAITVGSTTILVNGAPVTVEDAPALQDGTLAVSYDTVERWGIYPFVVYNADKTDFLCWVVIP